MKPNSDHERGLRKNRVVASVLVSLSFFILSMICIAVLAIVLGIIDRNDSRFLEKWMFIQLGAGLLFATLSGYVCRRMAGSVRGPLYYASGLFTLGLLEAIELMRYIDTGITDVAPWAVLSAPVVAAIGVLLGAWRPGSFSGILNGVSTIFHLALPIMVLVLASLLAMFVLPSLKGDAEIISAALTLDFTVVVPALFYVFAVRTGRLPLIALVPVFVAGYTLANLMIPHQHQNALDLIRFVIIPAEAAIVIYLVVAVRRSLKSMSAKGDFVTQFRAVAQDVLKNRIPADIFTTELSLFYHAFRKSQKKVDGGFTVHHRVGYVAIVVALILAIAVETLAVHFFVVRWSVVLAWVLTGLSIYSIVWLLGDCRALMSRLTCFSGDRLLLRFGLRWEADIQLSNINAVEIITSGRGLPFIITLSGNPNIRVSFHDSVEFVGLYGIRKKATLLALRLDDPIAFRNELQMRIDPTHGI